MATTKTPQSAIDCISGIKVLPKSVNEYSTFKGDLEVYTFLLTIPSSSNVFSCKLKVRSVTVGIYSYAQSKLALTMWSFHLAKKEPNITVIAVNPGSLLNTKMANEAYGQYWSPADKGVSILYDLALSEAYKNDSGKYFDNDKGSFLQAHSDAYSYEKIKSLLALTDSLLV